MVVPRLLKLGKLFSEAPSRIGRIAHLQCKILHLCGHSAERLNFLTSLTFSFIPICATLRTLSFRVNCVFLGR